MKDSVLFITNKIKDQTLKIQSYRSSLVVQQVKDLALLLQWHGFQSLARELPHTTGVAKKAMKLILYICLEMAYCLC